MDLASMAFLEGAHTVLPVRCNINGQKHFDAELFCFSFQVYCTDVYVSNAQLETCSLWIANPFLELTLRAVRLSDGNCLVLAQEMGFASHGSHCSFSKP